MEAVASRVTEIPDGFRTYLEDAQTAVGRKLHERLQQLKEEYRRQVDEAADLDAEGRFGSFVDETAIQGYQEFQQAVERAIEEASDRLKEELAGAVAKVRPEPEGEVLRLAEHLRGNHLALGEPRAFAAEYLRTAARGDTERAAAYESLGELLFSIWKKQGQPLASEAEKSRLEFERIWADRVDEALLAKIAGLRSDVRRLAAAQHAMAGIGQERLWRGGQPMQISAGGGAALDRRETLRYALEYRG